MSIQDYNELDAIHLDVLREIGNIGSGNAATSLSEMLARRVDIAVPTIRILDYSKVVEELGGPETMCVGLLLSLEGDVSGMIMFLLQQEFAHMSLNALLGESIASFADFGDMEFSAMKEIGNIMAASYVNAISSMTGMNINITVPDICLDMLGAIISVPAIHYANISDKIIFIGDAFSSDGDAASSHILMIPDMESLNKIMTNLGISL